VSALKRLISAACSSLVMLLLLVVLGSLMTSPTGVTANTEHVTVQSPDTGIAASGFTVPHEGSYQTKESRITIRLNDAVSIHAVVREPIGASGARPACLFLHGAGTGDSSEVYGDVASAMASAGIVTLVPDKRLDNYSTLHRDYPQMAEDYGRSFDTLKHWPGVDAQKTGLYAESEGTWISSIITANRKDVAFSILTSAPVVSGRQQMTMAASTYFTDSGAPRSLINDVPKLTSMDFRALGLEYANFDSTPYLSKLTQPVLVNYGTGDLSMPIEQGAQTILNQTASAGNSNVTVRYYPANHQMRTGSHLSRPGLPLESSYTRNLEDWINSVTMGATASDWSTPMIAGAQPSQRYSAPTSVSPGLISSLGVLLTLLGLALGASVLCGLCAAGVGINSRIRSRGRRSQQEESGRLPGFGQGIAAPLTLLVSLSTLSLLATLWYVGSSAVQALSLHHASVAFSGVWTVLRVAAIILVLLFGWLCSSVIAGIGHANRSSAQIRQDIRIAHGSGHQAVVLLGLVASVLVMISLAFWGLYTL
jgi:hypothetical protein